MGAGPSIQSIHTLKTFSDIQDLSEEEVSDLYEHLVKEYEKKLKEITVSRLETVLVRRLTTLETGKTQSASKLPKLTVTSTIEDKDEKIEEEKDEEEKPNVPQRLLSKLLADQQVLNINKDKAKNTPKSQVQQKALVILGDRELDTLSREILPSNAKVNKKALQMLGEEKILPERLQKRLGNPMTDNQRKAQKKQKSKEEEAAFKAKVKKDLNKIQQEEANSNVLGM